MPLFDLEDYPLKIFWRIIRWTGASLVLIFLVAAGKLWIDRFQADQAVQKEIARLDAIDPGWRYEDIAKQWKKIAPEENGALWVLEIAKDWPTWNQNEKEKWDDNGNRIIPERERIKQEMRIFWGYAKPYRPCRPQTS